MELPFTQHQFFQVFAAYNTAIWPVQALATALGACSILLLFWRPRWSDRAIAGILASFWIGMGVGYHWSFFAKVNSAAYLFGAIFLAGAIVFLVEGTIRDRIRFDARLPGTSPWLAGLLAVYGFIVYPILGLFVTHPYPETPLFGVVPCPTTIFTLALLLMAKHPRPWLLAAVPLTWGIIGGSAAFLLDVPQDWGLIVAVATWIFARFAASQDTRLLES